MEQNFALTFVKIFDLKDLSPVLTDYALKIMKHCFISTYNEFMLDVEVAP